MGLPRAGGLIPSPIERGDGLRLSWSGLGTPEVRHGERAPIL